MGAEPAAGDYLREWRKRRRLSQLELALDADVSTRHLSFVETGRSRPSREMIVRLAERLDIPLRERNRLLLAAGFAPLYPERSLDDPALDAVLSAVRLVLKGHEPYPALAVDRHWRLVASNDSVMALLTDVNPRLLEAPINVLRLSLHPEGVAPRIRNLPAWREHLLRRLRRQTAVTGDAVLKELLAELERYTVDGRAGDAPGMQDDYGGVVVPLQLVTDRGLLSFFSTTTVFGTPLDITVSELAIEAFFPADRATALMLRRDQD